MSTSGRPVISLSRRQDGEVIEEPTIVLDFFEVLLPCRKFKIGYKVAERGAASITSEFVLRLLYSVDGMEELAIADFFGFDNHELGFVMDEVTVRDYAVRRDGQVWLTKTGRSLFRDGAATPSIFSVEKRSDIVGFDLLSLCPQDFEAISRFDLALPELIFTDATIAEGATKRVHSSFHKHFSEIGLRRRESIAEVQQYLYSVDSVVPEQRFFSVVPVTVTAKGGRSSSAEVDLGHWRSGHELEDRDAILGAISNYTDGLKKHKHIQDTWAYNQLGLLAPEFLDDFIRQDGLAVERFHKSAVARVGDLRADRPTIPLIGSLFTPSNNEKIRLALDYAITRLAADTPRPHTINWLIPSGHWGFTRALPATLAALKRVMTAEGDPDATSHEVRCVAWRPSTEKFSRLIADNFGDIRGLSDDVLPTLNLEILWIPGLIVAALVHAPIKSVYSFPVPLGILSFDPKVVDRVQEIIGPAA